MLKIRIKANTLLNIAGMCILGIVCFVCTQLGLSDKIPEFMTGFILCLGSQYIIYSFRKTHHSAQLFWILLAGYLLRILCLFLDLYGWGGSPIIHSGGDSENFYCISTEYYRNNFTNYSTKYPYVIWWIYEIFGQNRFLAQYVNVFFWFLTVKVIIHMCESFGIEEKNRLIPYMVLAFWPNWVFLSSILLRESIQIFFDALSFYYFVSWMRSRKMNKLVLAFLLVLPALYLHMVSIAVWAAYIVVLSVWDIKKQKMVFDFGKLLKMIFLCILFLIICFYTPLKGIVLSKINNGFTFYGITHQIADDGNSDYLREMDCQYWYQFIPFTVIRMFYFAFSPLPPNIRRLSDSLAFLMDVLPTFILTGGILWNMRRSKGRGGYAAAGLWVCFMLVGIFAWGTSNAGTAMRHRTIMIGVWMMAYCLSMEQRAEHYILQERIFDGE